MPYRKLFVGVKGHLIILDYMVKYTNEFGTKGGL